MRMRRTQTLGERSCLSDCQSPLHALVQTRSICIFLCPFLCLFFCLRTYMFMPIPRSCIRALTPVHPVVTPVPQVPSLCLRQVWNKAVVRPYHRGDAAARARLHCALHNLMWRTQKVDVVDELHLPAQTERLDRLRLAPVEAHYYRTQHEVCAAAAAAAAAQCRRSAREQLDEMSSRRFLNSLLKEH